MSQFGNQFAPKPSAKTIRVAVPAKPAAAPATAPVAPAKPPVTANPSHSVPQRPHIKQQTQRIPPEKPRLMESPREATPPGLHSASKAAYTRIFRWRMPDSQAKEPASVEIVGSFTNWHKVSMTRDSALDSWHVTLHNIQGYKTHHYMLLVDGKPAHDKNADGVAPPNGPQEAHFQLMTPRGPRVFMLFAQTK
jgi:hypothetical protein